MKKAIIIRGLPGSGKSTLAADLILGLAIGTPNTAIICEADQYFHGLQDNGIYKFKESRLSVAHDFCRTKFEFNCFIGTNIVVCSNTNIKRKDVQIYKDIAIKYGYEVQVITVGEFTDEAIDLYASRNEHQVPKDIIQKMRDSFEP